MNDNTAKLLEQLAQKLGTTSEYLWRVLLKQAPIDATVNVIQIVCVLLFGYALWIIHKRLMKKESNETYAETYYEKYDIGAALPMILGAVTFMVLFICCFACIGDVVSGYFNPEYWSLKRVLSSLK